MLYQQAATLVEAVPRSLPTASRTPAPTLRPEIPMPGVIEQILVVLTTFVLYHQTPNVWFLQAGELEKNASNPMAAAAQLALMGLAILRILGSIDHLINLVRIDAPLFVFAALPAVSMFWSADPGETIRRGVMFAAATLFGSYLLLRFPLEKAMALLGWMFVLSAVVNLMWIVVFPEAGIDRVGRFDGIFPQKNGLGYVNALAIPTLLLAGLRRSPVRWVFLGAALLHGVMLVASESKTMLVAGLGTAALMPVYHLFRGRKTVRGAVLLSLGGSGLFAFAFSTANIGLLTRWLDKDATLTGRVPLWEALIDVGLERPFLGHGWAAVFGGYFSPVHEAWITGRWEASDAHNAVMQIWLEIGIVGVVLFGWTYGRAVLRAIRIVAIVPGPAGLWPLTILTLALLVSLTESGMQSDGLGWTLYTLAVLVVGAHLKYRSDLGYSNEIGDNLADRRAAPDQRL